MSEKNTNQIGKEVSVRIHNEIASDKTCEKQNRPKDPKVGKPIKVRVDRQGFIITDDGEYLEYMESIRHNC